MRAGFPAHRFPETPILAMGISQDLRNVRPCNPLSIRPVSPAILCPVDDLLALAFRDVTPTTHYDGSVTI
jgi:hypothetical protein